MAAAEESAKRWCGAHGAFGTVVTAAAGADILPPYIDPRLCMLSWVLERTFANQRVRGIAFRDHASLEYSTDRSCCDVV